MNNKLFSLALLLVLVILGITWTNPQVIDSSASYGEVSESETESVSGIGSFFKKVFSPRSGTSQQGNSDETCVDEDGYANVEVASMAYDIRPSIFRDKCDGPVLKEGVCKVDYEPVDPNNPEGELKQKGDPYAGYVDIDCSKDAFDMVCRNAVCYKVPEDACYDTDDGEVPKVFGKTVLGGKKAESDSCVGTKKGDGTSHVLEWSCESSGSHGGLSGMKSREIACEGDSFCHKGACVDFIKTPELQCKKDSDCKNPLKPRCLLSSNTCVQCLSHNDCNLNPFYYFCTIDNICYSGLFGDYPGTGAAVE